MPVPNSKDRASAKYLESLGTSEIDGHVSLLPALRSLLPLQNGRV
jgi:hypothetical protein